MDTQRLPNNVVIAGNLQVGGTKPAYSRSELEQDDFQYFDLQLQDWRVWDAFATTLPGTSATDDLGLYTGTWATALPYIATSDLKAAGATTRYARILYTLPECYVAGQTIQIAASAGMLTTVADTTATIDFELYLSDDDTTIGGSDLVSTAATTINSLTFAEKTFTITATSLAPGDLLDIRMAVAVNDGATLTAVIAAVARLSMKLDVKG